MSSYSQASRMWILRHWGGGYDTLLNIFPKKSTLTELGPVTLGATLFVRLCKSIFLANGSSEIVSHIDTLRSVSTSPSSTLQRTP